jgi:hypothetical protein
MIRHIAEAATSSAFPTVIFGGIAMSLFLLLGWITWSFRDVANRHADKADDSQGHH